MIGMRLSCLKYLSLELENVFSIRLCRNLILFRTYNSHGHLRNFKCLHKHLLVKSHVNFIRFYSKDAKICWNCEKEVDPTNFTCTNCNALQHPDPKMTYFQLLGLPENFNLDGDDISMKYKNLQKLFHPDKYVNKKQEEIDISDNYSRLVNKAYSTLKNPLSRGLYILNLNGLETEDDSVKIDQSFLMEVLEINEEVENTKNVKALKELAEENSKKIAEFTSMTAEAFAASNLNKARETLMKMKYFVNIDNEIKKKKSAMGIVD